MAGTLTDGLIQQADQMAAARTTFATTWEEIRKYIQPDAAPFLSQQDPGAKNRQAILDGSGEEAADILAGALHGHLTNPGVQWFKLRAQLDRLNKDRESILWLAEASRVMKSVLDSPDNSFGTSSSELYRSVVDFGNGCLEVRARPGRAPIFQSRPLAELYFAENSDSKIDTVFRRFRLSARAAVQQWGAAKVGKKVAEASVDPKKSTDKFQFLHCVYPNTDRIAGRLDAANMPIASAWIGLEDKQLMKRSGYPEMPFITPRWGRRPGAVYGHGPGGKALPDVKMLQRVAKVTIEGEEGMVKPALMVADDGVITVNARNHAINYIRPDLMGTSRDPIRPIQNGARPDVGNDRIGRIIARVQTAYFNDLVRLSRDPRMTATQALILDEEALRVLGPFTGRLQDEWLGPLIKRVFGILLRAGFFPPPPAALAATGVRVEYVSPTVRAQRLSEVRAFAQAEEVTASLVARDQTVTDNLDGDEAYRFVHERMGTPPHLMRDSARVAAMRQARQQVAAQERDKQDFVQLAPAAQSAAQAVQGMSQVAA